MVGFGNSFPSFPMPSTHLWSRLSSVKWEDAWVERLRFAGEQNLVIRKFPASRSIRLDLYTDATTAKRLKKAFGGTVRPFDPATWTPPPPKSTAPLRFGGILRIYGDAARFARERDCGRGSALLIPSGMAFGTGDHATTARCLRLLTERTATLAGSRWSLLDLGCGSGILALAAERLGAGRILGVDFDETCVRVSGENARINGLSRSRFRKADVLRWKPPGTWDIVAANLYSTILTAAAERIAGAVREGGYLILSGILSVEEPVIRECFTRIGLCHGTTLRRGKWAAMLLEKPVKPLLRGAVPRGRVPREPSSGSGRGRLPAKAAASRR